MSLNPFTPDAAVPARLARITPAARAALTDAAMAAAARSPGRLGANTGGVLPAVVAADLVATHGLDGPRDLMRLLVDPARTLARPPISGFFVGAVGMERDTGDLILGGNVEFPGTHLGLTIHGEGFVATRAFSRGQPLTAIAVGEAHPCAHCRQYLSEFASGPALELIDPLGHSLRLGDLYPWPFDPDYLGETGAQPGAVMFPGLQADAPAPLLATGRRAHAPYSRCPGAVMLHLAGGQSVTGVSIESVAFNPTMQPMMAALIDLIAHGFDYADIRGAVLGTVTGGAVDYAASTAELLARVAPTAPLQVIAWHP
jgi:cytidine deaminase